MEIGPRYMVQAEKLGDTDTLVFRRDINDKVFLFMSIKTPDTRFVAVSQLVTTSERRHNVFMGRTLQYPYGPEVIDDKPQGEGATASQ